MSSPPVTLGILSTARIAGQFIQGLRGCAAVRIDAIASREQQAAERFAGRHRIARWYGRYEDLLADDRIEAVYVPLPNALHAPWVERALRAGKHVLCEKPLTVTLSEAQHLFQVARETGRVLLEAYPYRFQPQTLQLLTLLDQGAIGSVRLLQAYFGFPLERPDDIRLDPALGGGALLDVGCYPVSLARLLFGRRPARVTAQMRLGRTGVDLGCTATLQYADGAIAQIGCDFEAALLRQALLVGSGGVIETDFANHTGEARPGLLRVRRGVSWDVAMEAVDHDRGNGFAFAATQFAALVRGERADDGVDRQRSLDHMATLEAIAASARTRLPVEVADPG